MDHIQKLKLQVNGLFDGCLSVCRELEDSKSKVSATLSSVFKAKNTHSSTIQQSIFEYLQEMFQTVDCDTRNLIDKLEEICAELLKDKSKQKSLFEQLSQAVAKKPEETDLSQSLKIKETSIKFVSRPLIFWEFNIKKFEELEKLKAKDKFRKETNSPYVSLRGERDPLSNEYGIYSLASFLGVDGYYDDIPEMDTYPLTPKQIKKLADYKGYNWGQFKGKVSKKTGLKRVMNVKSVFYGQVDLEDRPHGLGVEIWTDGTRNLGYWEKGEKKNGGLFICFPDGYYEELRPDY